VFVLVLAEHCPVKCAQMAHHLTVAGLERAQAAPA
jgi:hypothetical protein